MDDLLCQILRNEQPDWPVNAGPEFAQELFDKSLSHGIHGLVWEKCHHTVDWQRWPETLRAELERVAKLGAAADLLRIHRVAAALEELRQQNVDVLTLKGGALAHTHYSSPGLRVRSDTDLLIRIVDIEQVCGILSESGFDVVPPIYKSHQFRAVSWQADRAPIVLDVHWRISNHPRYARFLEFGAAWGASIALEGHPGVHTLCPVDSLMLACVHRDCNLREGRDRLIWLYDIHLLASQMSEQEMMEFAESAVARRVQDPCAAGISQARALLKTKCPEKALEPLFSRDGIQTGVSRFAESNLALLMDDFRCLPGKSRWSLARELLFPAPRHLLSKYGKQNRLWLPWLYLRQAFSGAFKRLSLR